MTTMKRYASGVLLAALVAGCTGGTTGSPTPVSGSALSGALTGVATAALGANGDFDFGDTVRLTTLATADKKVWGYEIAAGGGPLISYGELIQEVLAVDLTRATSILTVGAPPARLVVVTGGQDAAAVTAAATKSGWKGSGTLTRAIDLSNTADETAVLTISAPQIRPAGADVVIGGAKADLSLAGPGKGTGPGAILAAGTNCLGDVVMAQGTGFAEKAKTSPTAVGVRATADKITSVICLGAGSADEATALADRARTDLASGSSNASRRPYKELLPGAVVEILSGTPAMVRITADTTGQTPDLVGRMLFQRDLPGGS